MIEAGVWAGMLVFWKEKLVFLAVPKTGTSAIEEVLAPQAAACFRDPPGLKHTPAYRFRRHVEPMLRTFGAGDLETVAVLRAPIDWLGSWFRYRSREALSGHVNSTAGLGFDEFVNAYLAEYQPAFANVGSQARFVCDGQGRLAVTHLFAYEDLPRLIEFFEHRLKRRITLPRRNISPDRSTDLHPRTEHRLRQALARDFALHGAVLRGEQPADLA